MHKGIRQLLRPLFSSFNLVSERSVPKKKGKEEETLAVRRLTGSIFAIAQICVYANYRRSMFENLLVNLKTFFFTSMLTEFLLFQSVLLDVDRMRARKLCGLILEF